MWRVIGGIAEGSSHRSTNRGCDDAYKIVVCEDGIQIVAVADGAGSARFAAEASKIAVAHSVEQLVMSLHHEPPPWSDTLWSERFKSVVLSTRSFLLSTARAKDVDLAEMNTTLILAAIHEDALAVAHIGDGAVVGIKADNQLEVISRPSKGEFANETVFLTSDGALQDLRVFVSKTRYDGVAFFTDGLEPVAMHGPESVAYPGFWTPLFDYFRIPGRSETDLEQFLRTDRLDAAVDDDRTLVLATREAA